MEERGFNVRIVTVIALLVLFLLLATASLLAQDSAQIKGGEELLTEQVEILGQSTRMLYPITVRGQAGEALTVSIRVFLGSLAGGVVILLAMVAWLIVILRQHKNTMAALNESQENLALLEEKLRRRQKLYAEMSCQLPCVFFQFYARTDGKFGLHYISEQSEYNFGLKAEPDGFLERFTTLVVPEQRKAFLASIHKAVSEFGNWYFEGMLNKTNGEKIWFLGNSIPSRQEDEIVFSGFLLDITDRKKAEEALKHSEACYRAIFNAVNDALYIHDITTGEILDANKPVCEIFGYSQNEIQRIRVGDLSSGIPPYTQEKADEFLRKAIAGEPQIFEWQCRHQDGHLFWMETSLKRVVLAGHERILAVQRDMTFQKQAEEALRLTQFAMNRAQDSIVWVDDQGVLTYVNDAACSSMGYSREELLRMTVFEMDPYFLIENWEQHKEALRRVGAMRFESCHRAKDGRIFPVEVTTNYLDHKGRFLAIAFGRDITERKQSEAELKRLLDEQDILLSNIDGHVWYLKDIDTYGAVNTAHARFFGKEKSMLENRSLSDVLSSSGETQVCMEGNRRVFEERRQIRTEEWVVNGQGESRLLAITKTPKLNEAGAVEYVVCFAYDITESKKMQKMMIETEKMMSLGGIAAGIAHEINNPLGIVLQAAQNLLQRTCPDFTKNVDAAQAIGLDMHLLAKYMRKRKLDVFIRDIESAALRAAVIIRHMLDFTHRSEFKQAVCDPVGIVQKALVLVQNDYDLKKNYDFKKIEVCLEMDDELPVINCMETEMEQVVLNLLRNTAQAMAEASPPVESPRINIRVFGFSGGLRIEVEDNGPGIPPEIQARIFDPFFTTKPPGQGTGLGLSVSYFIVTQSHKGRMTVESEPGAGTRFIIELPAAAARVLES